MKTIHNSNIHSAIKKALCFFLIALSISGSAFAQSYSSVASYNSADSSDKAFSSCLLDFIKTRNLTPEESNGSLPIYLDNDTLLDIPLTMSSPQYGQHFTLSAISSDNNILTVKAQWIQGTINFNVRCTPISLGTATVTISGSFSRQYVVNVVDPNSNN